MAKKPSAFKSRHSRDFPVFITGTLWVIPMLFMASLFACKTGLGGGDSAEVARVGEERLLRQEVLKRMPADVHGKDSLALFNRVVQDWVEQQVLLAKAKNNLSAEEQDVEQELEDYRNSLLIYRFERELVRQKLDTAITDSAITQYYKNHPQEFALKDNIVQVMYVRVPKKTPSLERLRTLMRTPRNQDRAMLEDYCRRYAGNYYLNTEAWLLFSDLLREIPINTYNQEQYLQNNRYVELSDENNLYLVHILGFRVKDGLSPLTFERQNIRTILINQRKLELIARMKSEVVRQALEQGDARIESKKP